MQFSDPLDVSELQRIFAELKKSPKPSNLKKFGQNFLVDRATRDAIIEAAQLQSTDTVLEIGPGSGVLTQQLVLRAKRVLAIDIDPYLLEVTRLAATTDGKPAANLELQLQDVRKLNLPKLFGGIEYVLVSNVPYYLTGYLLELFTSTSAAPKRMVLTLQKEVAERITAAPDNQSILSISIALFGTAQLVREIPRDAFWPAPEVDSAVIVIERHAVPPVEATRLKQVMRVVKAGFSQRRKKLANALAGGLQLELNEVRAKLTQLGFSENVRAQELSVADWAKLSQVF